MSEIKPIDLELPLHLKQFIDDLKPAKEVLKDAHSIVGIPSSYLGIKPKEEKK